MVTPWLERRAAMPTRSCTWLSYLSQTCGIFVGVIFYTFSNMHPPHPRKYVPHIAMSLNSITSAKLVNSSGFCTHTNAFICRGFLDTPSKHVRCFVEAPNSYPVSARKNKIPLCKRDPTKTCREIVHTLLLSHTKWRCKMAFCGEPIPIASCTSKSRPIPPTTIKKHKQAV